VVGLHSHSWRRLFILALDITLLGIYIYCCYTIHKCSLSRPPHIPLGACFASLMTIHTIQHSIFPSIKCNVLKQQIYR
jgi:hypothetical protein